MAPREAKKTGAGGWAIWAAGMALLPLALLCGCASGALHNDYEGYSEVYADSSNKQLLLNLAREANQEPIYFIQLASISSQHQYSTYAAFNPSAVAPLIRNTLSLGGNVNATASSTPVFQFLPLNGSSFVQAIMAPISDKVFYTFYDQGWPVDWLLRTVVDSVQKEVVVPATATSPATTNHEVYFNHPRDTSYPKFLQFCRDLRFAQEWHELTVDTVSNETQTVFISPDARMGDIIGALGAGLTVSWDQTNRAATVKKVTAPDIKFVARRVDDEGGDLSAYRQLFVNEVLPNIKGDAEKQEFVQAAPDIFARKYAHIRSFAKALTQEKITFKMRTFESAMYLVANEQQVFKLYETVPPPFRNVTFAGDPYGTVATVTPGDGSDYPFTVRPILMTQYDADARARLTKMVELDYQNDINRKIGRNEVYTIGDLSGGCQNRAVFTILSYLFSQTAISTQNLPVQQLIQVQ